MTEYHNIHYATFHMHFPNLLWKGGLQEIIDASNSGTINHYLCEMWRSVARSIIQSRRRIPSHLDVTHDSFSSSWTQITESVYLFTATTPPIGGPLEAGAVAIIMDTNFAGWCRYFTCESPAEQGAPWMVGEYAQNGGRANLGALGNASVEGFQRLVLSTAGFEMQQQTPNTGWIYDDQPRHAGPFVAGNDGVEVPVNSGDEVWFRSSWSSHPSLIAEDCLSALEVLRTMGQQVLILNSSRILGLDAETNGYMQFLWTDEGGLIAEIGGDFSHEGLQLPPSARIVFESCGLREVEDAHGNFGCHLTPDTSRDHRHSVLTSIFGAFQATLRPTGIIEPTHF